MNETRKQVVIIGGPTGSGESTITNAIVDRFPNVRRLRTATTRAQRSEETPETYFFFSKEEFLEKAEKGEILEVNYQATRDTYYGIYAPALNELLEKGYTILINTDIVGAKYCKEHYNATTLFIEAASIEELVSRIRGRNPEMSDEEVEKRRIGAENEIRDEKPFYDYVIVNGNGRLEESIERAVAILKEEGYTLE